MFLARNKLQRDNVIHSSACKRVHVNTGCAYSPTTIYAQGISSYVCPARVDRNNWLTEGEDHVRDVFEINQDGNIITVTRTNNAGWCIDLSFECCRGELGLYAKYYCLRAKIISSL